MRIRETVDYLCSDVCAGRKTGSPEGIAARRYLIDAFEQIGLAETTPSYEQAIPGTRGANVVGHLDGESERTILVAAHYDHLGRTGGDAYWGADDNAAAVAILLEVARGLKARDRLGRRVLFCAFDAEEPPHFMSSAMGSCHFVYAPLIPLESIDMMICMDLMGHALGSEDMPDAVRRSVFALGAEKTAGAGAIVETAGAETDGVAVRRLGGDVVPPLSDYYPFAEAQVPYLFLTNGRWDHYHAVTDTPEKLDYDKIAASAAFLETLVAGFADRPDAADFDPTARDDAATLATIRAIGGELAKYEPSARRFGVVLEKLEACVERDGALGLAEQMTLSSVVAGLESLLA